MTVGIHRSIMERKIEPQLSVWFRQGSEQVGYSRVSPSIERWQHRSLAMKTLLICAGAASMMLASSALAQNAASSPPADGSAAASFSAPPGTVVPAQNPATDAANASFEQGVSATMAAQRAQQQAEWQRYHEAVGERKAAVAARREAIAAIRTRQAMKEAAYDRAMAAWHAQVAACNKGDKQACLAPTPST
ncbi:MAG: hypothetical protein KGJ57_15025 [Sphingomonadales bacterium]|nr:hypothetical protein [Sphingomonadales bacterium]MDE2170717.1 hypothetical protein [Sphingomonadales bacterium]